MCVLFDPVVIHNLHPPNLRSQRITSPSVCVLLVENSLWLFQSSEARGVSACFISLISLNRRQCVSTSSICIYCLAYIITLETGSSTHRRSGWSLHRSKSGLASFLQPYIRVYLTASARRHTGLLLSYKKSDEHFNA